MSVVGKDRQKHLIVECNEPIGYSGLMSLKDIEKLLKIDISHVITVLDESYDERFSVNTMRHSVENNSREYLLQELQNRLNNKLQ